LYKYIGGSYERLNVECTFEFLKIHVLERKS
jgi:hypothetical protein